MSSRPRVAIISFPWASPTPTKLLSELCTILSGLSNEITVIGGNVHPGALEQNHVRIEDLRIRLHYVKDHRPAFVSSVVWLGKCIFLQIMIAFIISSKRREIDVVMFYLSFPYHLPALFVCRLLGLRTVEIVTRSRPGRRSAVSVLEGALNRIGFMMLDSISLESPSLERLLPLNDMKQKLTVPGYRFINTSKYHVTVPFEFRPVRVGFVGRMTEEKGVGVFLEAIRLILAHSPEVSSSGITFSICGVGPLDHQVDSTVLTMNGEFGGRIEYKGWIPDDELPGYLNSLRVLALPTRQSEGLPTSILEAMACGVVVLAPPVGGIPDVIRNGETGYLLRSIDPKDLAGAIVKTLLDPGIVKVSVNATEEIPARYSFASAIERYSRILEDTMI